jgi:hypothetical protein
MLLLIIRIPKPPKSWRKRGRILDFIKYAQALETE